MTQAWPRLAVLVLPVLAAHLLLLAPRLRTVQPPSPPAMRFITRSVPAALALPPAPQPIAAPREFAVAVSPPQRPAPPTPRRVAPAKADRAPLPTAPPAPEVVPLAFAIPAPARLHYEVQAQVRGLPVQGEAHLAWRHDGDAYDATLDIVVDGLPARTQRSTGRITAQGLAPAYFWDKARNEQATHFDREHGRLVFSNNRPQADLADGMQDRLSVILQLCALLAGEAAKYPPGTQIAVPTATTREAQTWIFDVQGEEDLQLPGGEVRALKLQRLPRGDHDQKIELWLSPRMDYAPVRLRLTNPDGGAVDQRWVSTDRG